MRSIVPEVPVALNEFIMEDCLAEKPSRRPTAEQMGRCLSSFSSNIVLKVKPKGLFGQ
jgi:hypothetical protein